MSLVKTVLIALLFSLAAFGADPFAGTWKPAHVDKWKSTEDMPERFKTERLSFELTGEHQYRYSRSPADDKPISVIWIVDGKEHQSEGVVEGNHEYVDEHHIRITHVTSDGTIVNDWVVASDGKTLTITQKGIGHGGRHFDDVRLYEKL